MEGLQSGDSNLDTPAFLQTALNTVIPRFE